MQGKVEAEEGRSARASPLAVTTLRALCLSSSRHWRRVLIRTVLSTDTCHGPYHLESLEKTFRVLCPKARILLYLNF